MPFLRLQPDQVIRYDDRTISSVTEKEYLYSLSCNLIFFPFEDAYDVPWQQYAVDTSCYISVHNKKVPVDPNYIYDYDHTPFENDGIEILRDLFRRITMRKLEFRDRTNVSRHGIDINTVIRGEKFLDYVFEAFYEQSYYRYAELSLFRETRELSEIDGFFIRMGLWGYFKKEALTAYYPAERDTYKQGTGYQPDDYQFKNMALSSSMLVNSNWHNRYDYVNWINNHVSVFNKNYKWVGLNNKNQYRGWLSSVCTNPASYPDISAYYNNKIRQAEDTFAITKDDVILANVVNELYENLTQINRFISWELSLYFTQPTDDYPPPPEELDENGYITITYSVENCLTSTNGWGYKAGGHLPAKLGTYPRDGDGYCPLCVNLYESDFGGTGRIPSLSTHLIQHQLTCLYGQTYEITDYERFWTPGREDQYVDKLPPDQQTLPGSGIPMISSYNRLGKPGWFIGINPYDIYTDDLDRNINPPTTWLNNGRSKHYFNSNRTEWLSDDFKGSGIWRPVCVLSVQARYDADEPNNISAYQPLGSVHGKDEDNGAPCGKILAAPFSYWSESYHYDTDFQRTRRNKRGEEIFDVHKFSSIKSCPYFSYTDLRNTLVRNGTTDFLSTGSEFYPRQTCSQYFPDYIHLKVRAVADKKYYPVFDTTIAELIYKFRENPLKFYFDNAEIKALRTGINPKTATTPENGHGGIINLDPYYMKYGHYFYNDSNPEKEDQKTGSRPITTDDEQWKNVYNEIIKDEHGWHGNYFDRNLNLYYVNPMGEKFPLELKAIVTDIGFLLQTNIILNSGYGFDSTVVCLFYSRDPEAQDIFPVRDLDNKMIFISKGLLSMNDTTHLYKIPLVSNKRMTPLPDDDYVIGPNRVHHWNIWPWTTGDMALNKRAWKVMSNQEFEETFAAPEDARKPAEESWNKLLTYIHTLFEGSDDDTRYKPTPVGSKQTYVFWLRHYAWSTKGNNEHVMKNGEHFYLVLRGFAFGVEYTD